MMIPRFGILTACLGVLLVVAACGETVAPSPTPLPPMATAAPATATPAPQGTSTTIINAVTATPSRGATGAVDPNVVRTIGVLEQTRGHLLAAQELSAAGAADQAKEQAGYPAQELLEPI